MNGLVIPEICPRARSENNRYSMFVSLDTIFSKYSYTLGAKKNYLGPNGSKTRVDVALVIDVVLVSLLLTLNIFKHNDFERVV